MWFLDSPEFFTELALQPRTTHAQHYLLQKSAARLLDYKGLFGSPVFSSDFEAVGLASASKSFHFGGDAHNVATCVDPTPNNCGIKIVTLDSRNSLSSSAIS
jgi:hypothetical protein